MTNWPELLLCGLLELKLQNQSLKRKRNNNAIIKAWHQHEKGY
jgi:hypothetical protein